MRDISIIIPAFNEAGGIGPTVKRARAVAHAQSWNAEIIVVDDGSTDVTGEEARAAGATVIRNPVNGGYGLSLQRGIRAARHAYVAITDADGTYPVEELPTLAKLMDDGLDMAVGSRTGMHYRQNWWKEPARNAFRTIAEFVAGRNIPDINSGLRVMRRAVLLPYLSQTCMGFSFTTSITLIFMLNGHFVAYHPIGYAERIGTSKVRHFRDTLRTTQIMTSIIASHNPIKLGIMLGALSVVSAIALLLVALVAESAWPLFSAFCGWVGAALVASAPVVFMLGCLGELLRVRTLHDPSA
jgi:polyisoprenyl-phosphate glycosyltransferase